MTWDAFTDLSLNLCSGYMRAVRDVAGEGNLIDSHGVPMTPTYPSMLISYEMPRHYAAELLGATRQMPEELVVIKRRLPSLDNFFGRFGASPQHSVFEPRGGGSITHLTIGARRDSERLNLRYPESSGGRPPSALAYDTPELTEADAFHAIRFLDSCDGDLWLNDVFTVNSWKGQVRARYFQNAWVVSKSMSASAVRRMFEGEHPLLAGADNTIDQPRDQEAMDLLAGGNFFSLLAVDRIGETTLTRFLEQNEKLLLRALGGIRLVPQPLFEWIEGNSDPTETAIQPDFLLIDSTGEAHICDAKLPLLD